MSHAQVLPDAVWSKKAVLVVGWPVVGRDGYRANSRCSAYFTSLQAEDLSGETSKIQTERGWFFKWAVLGFSEVFPIASFRRTI